MRFRSLASLTLSVAWGLSTGWAASVSLAADETPSKISYDRQIRPIFQANCQGCHQPAKAGGDYVMTSFERLLKAGESGTAGVVPGKPDESELLRQITPGADGKAEMPKDKPALSSTDVELVKKWIEQGAIDDTPVNAVQKIDADHPPVYTRAPVITAIDFSPDGKLLAIAGFHEVILQNTDSGSVSARLIGLSERIESVKFSPDGKKLAVSGGFPAGWANCRSGMWNRRSWSRRSR